MNDWIKCKDQMPALHEFVEVIYPDDSCMCGTNRGFAVRVKHDDRELWSREGLDEDDWSSEGFGIKYWRPMAADHKGRKVYLRIDSRGYFKIYLKK